MKIFLLCLFIFSAKLATAKTDYIVKVSNPQNFILSKNYDEHLFGPYFGISKENLSASDKSDFEIIEENFDVSIAEDFRPVQWALNNLGNNEPRRGGGRIPIPGVVGADLNIMPVWEQGIFGSKKTIIAVIDTGVDYKHFDLKDNMLINLAEKNGKDGIDDDGNGFVDDIYGYNFSDNNSDPMDENKHGTHVSGIIGAAHNSNGVDGVMKNVSILAVKFMDKKGRGDIAGAIKAINYALVRGAKILNNSWGALKKSEILQEIIEQANQSGVIFVAAAGNSYANNDINPRYPANHESENLISVAAINPENRMTGFSCYGPRTVHVAAPGRNIISTVPKNKYMVLSGTSMSAPYVAGAIGLLLTKYPNLTPLQVREKLISTSTPVEHLNGRIQANGRINIAALLE
ncbi:S8 family peptidase [Halobacteriovorax sp. HLS]|uniref:S8 family peptidase n=1 Tax=Halobacteriovorax sp. HLS TaxID=2234000 RepID=UPI000FDB6659|nr:S8 family peptidase [Halobacteriovorax sp. HLS]